MFKPRVFSATILAAALALTFGARSASADTYTLDSANTALSAFPGPYGTVTVSLSGTGVGAVATITYDASQVISGATTYQYLFGGAQAADANVNSTDFTPALVSETNTFAGFTPTFDKFDSGNADGFGKFTLTGDNKDGYGDSATQIVFTVTNNNTGWNSASDVLISNGTKTNAFVAAHVFVATVNSDGSLSDQAVLTGFAGNHGAVSVVPEPSTLAIAGLGALGFFGYGLRRRLKK